MLRISLLLLLAAAPIIRAEYSADEFWIKSRATHTQVKGFSMQVWSRSFEWSEWHEKQLFRVDSSVYKIVRGHSGQIVMAGIERHSNVDKNDKQLGREQVTRLSFRIEPGPRFLHGEWSDEKNKVVDRPVTADIYRKELMDRLSRSAIIRLPFDGHLFDPTRHESLLREPSPRALRIAGRENISGHQCLRLETASSTLWFDEDSLLMRRGIFQPADQNRKFGEIVEVYCDIRPLAVNEVPNLAPVLDDTFETKSMQWVPFIPLEQLRENIRITGRAAGLLIAAPADQTQAQPALPPLTPEQRASIVTIEGDVLSGLGFYSRHKDNDFLVTDVRFVTENRWIKVRDWQGNALSFTGVFQATDARVALLKATSVPGRILPSNADRKKDALSFFMICAFDKGNAAMQPAFCVSRSSAEGSYTVVHDLADYISGGPIINVDDGSVAGVLIKSDPPKDNQVGPATPRWHAESLFSHSKWIQIGSIPVR